MAHLAVLQNTSVVDPYVEYVNAFFKKLFIYKISTRLADTFFMFHKHASTIFTRHK